MTPPSPRSSGALPEPKPLFDWFFALATLCVIAIYVRAIFFTPIDAMQGPVQKIYYLHVPAAIAAYTATGLMAVTSLVYLWLGDERADRFAEASAEVALMFVFVVLTTGPMWARQQWGTYWAWWDMRLTLTLFFAFVIAGYLVMRGAVEDDATRARYSAVMGCLAALLIPFIHLSVYMFQARLHPMPVALKPDKPSMSPEMMWTFFPSMIVFTLMAVAFIRARYQLGVLRDVAKERFHAS